MLSAFPTLLSWNLAAPLLIRLVLGGILIHWSIQRFRRNDPARSTKNRIVAALDAVLGVLLVIGLWVQPVALLIMIDLAIRLVRKARKRAFFTDGVNYYFLLLVLATTLLVSGAGWLALDASF